jgi:lipid II:glycine glycyltransferase (peptidoglycan interpeptide bridge formation enzyme)
MPSALDAHHRTSGQALDDRYRTGPLTLAAVPDQSTWDSILTELDGHLMQSWAWGEFKRQEGWRVERLLVSGASGIGMAQVLFLPRGPITTAFIPRGPHIVGDQEAVAAELLSQIDAACRRHRSLTLAIESARVTPYNADPASFGFHVLLTRFSPGRTVVVPLLEDEPLLAQMNAGTRTNIRRAGRNGVEIRREAADEAAVFGFHTLLRETSERQGFPINPPSHYLAALRLFGDDASLHVASVAGTDVAGLIAARFGDLAIYLFGASMSEQPVRGATALLQYEAMRWARSRGATRYDLWGIDDPFVASADDSLARSTSRDCAEDDGLCRFKVGFGGTVEVFPRRLEHHYHPRVVDLLRRAVSLRQASRR